MATPAAPGLLDVYSYCEVLRHELHRLHDRLDRLEFGEHAASTPAGHSWRSTFDGARWHSAGPTPAPTPAFVAATHTFVPLAETLPTVPDSPACYSCTLVVPDSVVGHIVGRAGAGLHQAHDASGAQLRAFSDRTVPGERRVSIRGTDQQIGEALIALGKRFMRKRVRSKKKRLLPSSEGHAAPPAGPVPAASHAKADPVAESQHLPQPAKLEREPVQVPHPTAAPRPAAAYKLPQRREPGNVTFLLKQSSPLFPETLPPVSAADSTHPIQTTDPSNSTLRHNPTSPFAPSVTMSSPSFPPSASSVPLGSPMQIDAMTGLRHTKQTARRSHPGQPPRKELSANPRTLARLRRGDES
jgi:hypothetical protein